MGIPTPICAYLPFLARERSALAVLSGPPRPAYSRFRGKTRISRGANGGESAAEPGSQPAFGSGNYAARMLDPDGYEVELIVAHS